MHDEVRIMDVFEHQERVDQQTRSQFQNKGICEDKILRKLTHLLQPPKIRKAPRKNKAADAKRRRDKLHHKLKKENRNLSLLDID